MYELCIGKVIVITIVNLNVLGIRVYSLFFYNPQFEYNYTQYQYNKYCNSMMLYYVSDCMESLCTVHSHVFIHIQIILCQHTNFSLSPLYTAVQTPS